MSNILFNTVVCYNDNSIIDYDFSNKSEMQFFNDELVNNFKKDDILAVLNIVTFLNTGRCKHIKLNNVWDELPNNYKNDEYGLINYLAVAYKTCELS